jgi:hypothetical protein
VTFVNTSVTSVVKFGLFTTEATEEFAEATEESKLKADR